MFWFDHTSRARHRAATIAVILLAISTAARAQSPAAPASTPAPKPAAIPAATPAKTAPASRAPAATTRRPVAKAAPTAKADTTTKAESAAPGSASKDMTLKGGQEGTVFGNLTVEGEDRIHFEIERPQLALDLDPEHAPGLDWGSARDVLDRTTPDLFTPLVATSSKASSPFLGRPWLSEFSSGAVARFRPDVQGVERWKLVVVDARGQSVTTFNGTGNPPENITWDGRSQNGSAVSPGLTYSYVFEAFDRAGNKRNFVGPGFSVTAYRLETPAGTTLMFSARQLGAAFTGEANGSSSAAAMGTPPILLEAASWLNQSERITKPIQVTAKARSYEQANRLATLTVRALAPNLIGDPARIKLVAINEPTAPEDGTVSIGPAP